ncbi:uncharacterized protein TM35_000341710 [Trypanosoma theileri]|uniref:Uncharacterized protein n=1 Tax=Trypanosoma theileri TaxID=67003 RepID=A0A1X0NN71_9TRYP|nr:uncharacterized protein TM35_000341710 [Trypanosoma theileri]ORC85559.1 hypothetical protein TM35_000341710 [Trypanosoma theileri]
MWDLTFCREILLGGVMWIELLEMVMWLMAFVYPLAVGAQLCRCARDGQPLDVRLVTNVTLALILLWMFDLADAVVFSYLFSVRSLVLMVRIALSLYLLHPRVLGASRVYERFLSQFVWAYAPSVNETVAEHLGEIERSGFGLYIKNMTLTFLNVSETLLETSRQLLSAVAEREVPLDDSERGIRPPLQQLQMPSVRSTPQRWGDVFSRESSRLSDFVMMSPVPVRRQQSTKSFVEYRNDAEISFSSEEIVLPLRPKRGEKR